MTFEELQKANETIKITPIERTDKKTGETIITEYAPVNQRIKAFRMVHPQGCINTHIERLEDGVVVMTASVFDENGKLLGTGTAYEKETSSYINKTSFIENCETSAVGRALGMCGFGIDTSIASAEEMQNALHEQAENVAVTAEMVKTLETCIPKNGGTIEAVCRYYNVGKLKELTVPQFKDCMNRMGEKA